jgi:SsrA-binding protein
MAGPERNIKVIVSNRKALHDYEILDRYEAGLELIGTEVKALRAGKAQLADSYAVIEGGEAFLLKMHISQYEMAGHENHDPTRKRRLLLSKREIRKLWGATNERGFTIVPLKLYFKGPWVKVELAVARGKKKYDKREAIIKRQTEREISRKLRDRKS